jgi:hypothetical protein
MYEINLNKEVLSESATLLNELNQHSEPAQSEKGTKELEQASQAQTVEHKYR